MVDLGKHATEVLSAYGVSVVILLGLLWASLSRSKRSKARLDELEK